MASKEVSQVFFWKPVNLTHLWVVHELRKAQNLEHRSLLGVTTEDGFYQYWRVLPHIQTMFEIPPRYQNALAIISAKICWLQLACQHKPLTKASTAKEQKAFELVLDGIQHKFEFTWAVQEIFLKDVKKDAEFECLTLNSWLFVEYHARRHFPPTYKEYEVIEVVEKHPLAITANGTSKMMMG
jgi:hypothetical protein